MIRQHYAASIQLGKELKMGLTPVVSLSADACREQATNCRKVAEQVMTEAHRIMLEHIAETWDRIAADIGDRTPAAPQS